MTLRPVSCLQRTTPFALLEMPVNRAGIRRKGGDLGSHQAEGLGRLLNNGLKILA